MFTRISTRAAALGATIALAAGLSACSDTAPVMRTSHPIVAPVAVAPAAPQAAAIPDAPAAAAAAVLETIEVRSIEMGFEPAHLTVKAPGRYAVKLVNSGALPHDLTFDDGMRITANPGTTVEGEVSIPATGLGFICSIPGHAAAGMKGTVAIEGAAPAGGMAHADDHGGPL
ncbi:MAG: hypothetical protein HGA45_42900, partial [Chloroflexales bacterium]|nr:hypothetical protein [Chloroflexales bacterium]